MKKHPDSQFSGINDFRSMDTGKKILFRSSTLHVPVGKTREEALIELKRRIQDKKDHISPYKRKDLRVIWRVLSAAAAIIFLIGVWQLFTAVTGCVIYAEKGAHIDYLLPDGSDVRLNADSRISFRKNRFSKEREVNFNGEAFFNVTKGGPFRVVTPKGEISVLGTTFNVYSRENSFKVTCFTGKVMVSSGEQNVTIREGESAELSDKTLRIFKNKGLKYISGWINGEFYFENSPLNLVFDEVERQFNVKFVTKIKKENLFYTGGFTNKDIQEALESICLPMNLNYEVGSNKKISVSYKE
jgi:transmembrane sensor